MVDTEKTYSVKFDTRTARDAIIALHRALERLEQYAEKAEKALKDTSSNKMSSRFRKFGRNAQKALQKIGDTANRVSRSIRRGLSVQLKLAATLVGGVAGAATLLVKEFAKIESAEAAFTPLLGGAEKAKKMVSELNKTAASTPFQFETLSSAANTLLPVMNGNIEETVKTLRMLGDTAGGNAEKYKSVTRGFTKAMLKGKVDMESLNMIAEAGVPIFTELAKSMDQKVGKKFFKNITAGKVSTEDLKNAFMKMTSEGGVFFRGMEIASKTLAGRWSTLKDNVSLTAASLGRTLAPTVKSLLVSATEYTQKIREWIENNKELINTKVDRFIRVIRDTVEEVVKAFREWSGEKDFLEIIADGFEMIGDALIFILRNWKVITRLTVAVGILVGVIEALSTVLAVVNTLAALNPIGLITLAVLAAIAAFTALVYWSEEVVAFFEDLPGPIQFIIATLLPMIGLIYLIAKGASLVKENWEPIVEWFTEIFSQLPDAFNLAVGTIEAYFWKMVKGLTDGFNALSRHITSVINPIIELFGGAPLEFKIDTSGFERDIQRLESENASASASLRNKRTVSTTKSRIQKYGGLSKERIMDEFAMQSIQEPSGGISIGDTNINIKTGSGDPKEIAKEVQKSFDKNMKRSLNQAARGIGASEQ